MARSSQLYECLVESASDVIFLLSADGTITFVNRCFERYTGLPAESLLDRHFSCIVHPDDIDRCAGKLAEVLATGRPLDEFDFRAVHPDGRVVYMVANGGPVEIDGKQAVMGICRDATESVRVDEKLHARNSVLSALNSIVVLLSSAESCEQALQPALERVLSALGISKGMIFLRQIDGTMSPSASAGFDLSALDPRILEAKLGIVEECVASGESAFVMDVRTDSRIDPEVRGLLLAMGVEAGVVLPLKHGGAVTAALTLALPSGSDIPVEQVEFVNLAAGILGPAIENVRLRGELADRVSRLAMLGKLAKSINDGRDVRSTVDACIRELRDLVEFDTGAVVLCGHGSNITTYVYSGSGENVEIRQMEVSPERLGQMMSIGAPLSLRNTGELHRFHSREHFATDGGSGAGAPLLYKGTVLGMLNVWSRRTDAFGSREMEIMAAAAEHLAIAVCNARLYEAERTKSLELEALAKEAQHRIKNNLQMITGLLGMSGESPDSRSALKRCMGQISAIAAVHDLLDRRNIGAELDLLECLNKVGRSAVVAAGKSDTVKLQVTGDGCTLNADAATALGIIVNELVSNAIEHGFADRGGSIAVRVSRSGQQTVVDVIDDGVGLPPDFEQADAESYGSGLGLVGSLARYGLGGGLEIARIDNGTLVRVTF